MSLQSLVFLSSNTDIACHALRFILHDNALEHEVRYLTVDEAHKLPPQLNPYGETPVLVHRETVLYGHRVIAEYLTERYPQCQLIPVQPSDVRAQYRQTAWELEQQAWPAAQALMSEGLDETETFVYQDDLLAYLNALTPLLEHHPWLMGDTRTLPDYWLAPVLWRLPVMGIELDQLSDAVQQYRARLLDSPAFTAALSPEESDWA